MKPERAIEILEKEEEDTFLGSEKDWKDAVKLGYEGLKAIINARANNYWTPIPPLPGETKEI